MNIFGILIKNLKFNSCIDLLKLYPKVTSQTEARNLLDVFEITSALMTENRETNSFYENTSFDQVSPNFEDVMVLTENLKKVKQHMELSETQVGEIVSVIKFVL